MVSDGSQDLQEDVVMNKSSIHYRRHQEGIQVMIVG